MTFKNITLSILMPILLWCCIALHSGQTFAQDQRFKVVLDAGHGGADPGNTGNGFKESIISLKVVLEVGSILEKIPDIDVLYTRKTDVAVNLYDRPKVANRADADLFVSIHCNSHSSQASGTETFVIGPASNARNFEVAKRENEVIFLEEDYEKNYEGFDPNSPESLIGLSLMQEDFIELSIQLAGLIESNFVDDVKRKSRGVKQSNFWVLHNTYMPSVLIELGFLTNNQEGLFLNSKSGQSKMAVSIAEAVIKYKSDLENLGTPADAVVANKANQHIPDADEVPNIIFKVQIAAGSKKIKTKARNFKGLEGVSVTNLGDLYRYYYGDTASYEQALVHQQEVKQRGYTSAFVVAFENGVKIPLNEALDAFRN